MRIEVTEKPYRPEDRPITFGDLRIGDVYVDSEKNICIKTEEQENRNGFVFNAVCLGDGEYYYYGDDVTVGFYGGTFNFKMADVRYKRISDRTLDE